MRWTRWLAPVLVLALTLPAGQALAVEDARYGGWLEAPVPPSEPDNACDLKRKCQALAGVALRDYDVSGFMEDATEDGDYTLNALGLLANDAFVVFRICMYDADGKLVKTCDMGFPIMGGTVPEETRSIRVILDQGAHVRVSLRLTY